jgi:SWI/SNF-related matrix-associated actin-dependent regulator 1 of chromatin subfamily A
MQGYHEVDAVLKGCEKVGLELERAMSAFMQLKEDEDETRAGELSVVNVDIDVEQKLADETNELRRDALKGYLKEQPKTIAEGVQLKDYQVSRLSHPSLPPLAADCNTPAAAAGHQLA